MHVSEFIEKIKDRSYMKFIPLVIELIRYHFTKLNKVKPTQRHAILLLYIEYAAGFREERNITSGCKLKEYIVCEWKKKNYIYTAII